MMQASVKAPVFITYICDAMISVQLKHIWPRVMKNNNQWRQNLLNKRCVLDKRPHLKVDSYY